ncbi:MAG: SpoIID/LytB domain-containing protein [Flavobacteriales bacterium]|nr:SpoIID/LytB domain-containing protein [Flavobacteriales bacterium]
MSRSFTALVISLLFLPSLLISSEVTIGLFNKENIQSVLISHSKGDYFLIADGDTLTPLADDAIFEIKSLDTLLHIKGFEKEYGIFKTIQFVTSDKANNLRIKCTSPEKKIKQFDGNFRIGNSENGLVIINEIDLDRYVSNVVEWESGRQRTLEYYKVQAIICRTYALGNIRKHAKDGYELCDKVHCQVYKGQSKGDAKIIQGTIATRDLVLVDENVELILATFHSNCGGQTMNSEDVWGGHRSYLRSVVDTFCLHEHNAVWEKHVDFSDWKEYVAANKVDNNEVLGFSQVDRKKYFNSDDSLPLTNVRRDWKLKSTFFNVSEGKEDVVIKGRGYGHGVGLCQEGAIHMAEIGFSFKRILEFYYNEIRLVSLNSLGFFKEE